MSISSPHFYQIPSCDAKTEFENRFFMIQKTSEKWAFFARMSLWSELWGNRERGIRLAGCADVVACNRYAVSAPLSAASLLPGERPC